MFLTEEFFTFGKWGFDHKNYCEQSSAPKAWIKIAIIDAISQILHELAAIRFTTNIKYGRISEKSTRSTVLTKSSTNFGLKFGPTLKIFHHKSPEPKIYYKKVETENFKVVKLYIDLYCCSSSYFQKCMFITTIPLEHSVKFFMISSTLHLFWYD